MSDVLSRFHQVLVEEIRANRPDYLTGPFTVAEIYQNLVPYGTHRDRIGVEMNGDYEDALLRLLAGEGGFLLLDSDTALRELREELQTTNPNTGLYREFAAVDVRLNPSAAGAPRKGETASLAAAVEDELDEVLVEDLAPAAPAAATPAATGAGPEAGGGSAEAAGSASVEEGEGEACRWCRAELPNRSNVNFCPFCGTDTRLVPCAACGEELEPGWRFCAACGEEVAV